MWQDRQAELLKEEIAVVFAVLSDTPGLYDLVKQPLTKAKRGLAPQTMHDRPWALLPLIVCESICGHYEQALPAAAALQLLMAAGDVFDDIQDADSSESLSVRYGSAVAVSVANTLLILAEKAITRLEGRNVEDYLIVRIMDAINSHCTTACVGQYLDLGLATRIALSEDMYLRIIGMKSASQVECACYIGALLANANQELSDTFAKFGYNLGMAAQITNDIQGITRGSDILKRKITLPVIYAFAQTDSQIRNQLQRTFGQQPETKPDHTSIKGLLFRSGAIHYATVKMEFYKQQALALLSKAEEAGASVERLKLFLE